MTGPAAIVCLTRGYADPHGYQRLIDRNRSIYEIINRRRKRQYPLIIWHQGNITLNDRRYILSRESNADVRFVDVSPIYRLPGGIKESELIESWSVGYRLMCRFHTYYIWQYVRQFEYVMRLDEDCVLISVAFDPLKSLSETGIDFATSAFVKETHELTNRTLAPFVIRYAGLNYPPMDGTSLYNHSFPYTNFYVTRTAFWRQLKVQRFLSTVIQDRNSIRLRWGDLPVLGIALNMFGRPGKVARILHCAYRHASHSVTVVSLPENRPGAWCHK